MLTFNISILYNVINILVLFVLLKIFLFKPVTEIMEKRKAMIQQDLDDAKKAKDDEEQMKGEYEDTLNTAKNQAADIVKDAKTRAEVEYNSIIEQGNKDAAAIMANADKTIAQEKERAIKQSKAEMADLAISMASNAKIPLRFAASKLVEKNVDATTNKKLIDDFLSEAGDTQ